jgi:ketosteroid isomerase-like protein
MTKPPREIALLKRMYREFNARNIDALTGVMHADVTWPNGWEGGYVVGHDAVRDYWTRQWTQIDPTVTPDDFDTLADGRVRVRVHQVIKDRTGKLMSDKFVHHTYTFEGGKIRGMVIEAAE